MAAGVPAFSREKCQAFNDVVFLNPRRDNFDLNDPEQGKLQISWEQKAIANSDVITFWFSKETVCPITLFELGCQLVLGDREIIVGIDPSYARRADLELQIPYYQQRSIKIVYSIEDLVNEVEDYYIDLNDYRTKKIKEYELALKELKRNGL